MKPYFNLPFAAGLAVIHSITVFAADHGHLNAGATGTKQGDPLIFANAADFAASSDYVKTLTFTDAGTYAGYFQGNITLTALPQTAAHAGPDPQAPALGSFIQAQLVFVEGPPGGAFSFWDSEATAPTITLLSGETGTNIWRLTEGDGAPDADPYGHFHGRRFTASQPGIYKVGFKLLDASANGVGGGPIHTASEVLPIWFQAGVTIQSVEPKFEEGRVLVRFGAAAGFTWQMEATEFSATHEHWQAVGDPVLGNDSIMELIDGPSPRTLRFYRIKGTAVAV
jgi:hypothetical protein